MTLNEWIDKRFGELKDTFGVRLSPWPLLALGLVGLLFAYVFAPNVLVLALRLALFTAPVWLAILLIKAAWNLWVTYVRSDFYANQKYVLLEIKPPRNLVKTPLAMEAVLAGLQQGGGEGTWYLKYWKGSTRAWFSLEIASFEGQVHFYIWTRANFRRLIEAQVYAQYPGAQVVEALDYTRLITGEPEEWSVWGCDFKHTEADPLPLKTYVEYGLDKVQKEVEQVDPLSNLIEFMGSMKKGEQLWVQMVIRLHKGEKYNKTKDDGKPYTWKDKGEEMIKKIREETRDPYVDPATGIERPGFPNPTKGQIETMAAIDRNTSKLAFDIGIRTIYLVRQGKFDVTVISGITAMFKQFSSEGWNGLRHTAWLAYFDDYPWEYRAEKLKTIYRRKLIEAYRRRQYFYEPFYFGLPPSDTMVMSTEEIATIYHIPSRATETPSLERIQSATSEAPANLPT